MKIKASGHNLQTPFHTSQDSTFSVLSSRTTPAVISRIGQISPDDSLLRSWGVGA
jgi:hypothetical protein